MTNRITELFGSKVFNDAVMRERLTEETYNKLHRTIKNGTELNPEIAQKELVDFLQAFYELRYNEHQRQRMACMPKIKERNTLREWLELAAEKQYQGFQLDEYADCYTPFPKGYKQVLSTDVEQIILSIDGKILMEYYYDLFSFFTKILRERLSAFQLANSLMVSIIG
jgi:hypothetical protein